MFCVCFHLKLILRISRFRIIVTHQDENELKKYNRIQLHNCPYCILYIIITPFLILYDPEDHVISTTGIQYIIYYWSNPLIFLHGAAFHFQYATSSLMVRFNCSTAFFLWMNWRFRNAIHPFLKTCSLLFFASFYSPWPMFAFCLPQGLTYALVNQWITSCYSSYARMYSCFLIP